MDNKIKVSIVVPLYNVEEYLEKCLNSLVKQTLKEIEVLIVDDGSTDSSVEIANDYVEKYDNFHIFFQKNSGQSVARNNGVKFAKGEYIGFVDSDDYITKDAYEKLYTMSQKGKIDIVTGNVKRVSSKGTLNSGLHRPVFKKNIENTQISKNPELLYDTTSWNKIYKRKFWNDKKLKFPEGIIYEDVYLTGVAYTEANSIAILTDHIYYWRVRDGENKSATQKYTDIQNFKDRIHSLNLVNDFFKRKDLSEKLIYIRKVKTLENDFRNYIKVLPIVDEKYLQYFISEVQKYIKNNIPCTIFKDIKAMARIQYYFIMKNDIESLFETIRFEKEQFKYLELEKKGNEYFGKFPFKKIPKSYFNMTKELNEWKVHNKIENLTIHGKNLTIDGYAYIKKINLNNKNKINLKAKLINLSNGKNIDLTVKSLKKPHVTENLGVGIRGPNLKNRRYNYDWSGYQVKFNLNRDDFLSLPEGTYNIAVNLEISGISRDIRLGSFKKKPILNPYLINHRLIQFKYSPLGDLNITILKEKGILSIQVIKKYILLKLNKKNSGNYKILVKNRATGEKTYFTQINNHIKIDLKYFIDENSIYDLFLCIGKEFSLSKLMISNFYEQKIKYKDIDVEIYATKTGNISLRTSPKDLYSKILNTLRFKSKI